MSFEPREYLRHILVEADYLIDRSAGLSYEVFVADDTLRRAFVRSLEIMGEAAKKVPDTFRAAHPVVEWRAMAGMRDRLIHDYLGVDFELVWEVLQERVPALRDQVASILEAAPDVPTDKDVGGGDPAAAHVDALSDSDGIRRPTEE